jgi:hypothetical protein
MQQKQQTQPQPTKPQTTRPDERGAIAVSSFLKISDPKTKQVFVETQA